MTSRSLRCPRVSLRSGLLMWLLGGGLGLGASPLEAADPTPPSTPLTNMLRRMPPPSGGGGCHFCVIR